MTHDGVHWTCQASRKESCGVVFSFIDDLCTADVQGKSIDASTTGSVISCDAEIRLLADDDDENNNSPPTLFEILFTTTNRERLTTNGRDCTSRDIVIARDRVNERIAVESGYRGLNEMGETSDIKELDCVERAQLGRHLRSA